MVFGQLFGFGKRSRPLILHIDDSALIIETTKSLLSALGCDTISALSGAQGIELAIKHKPDLILVDAMMPQMDGYQTTHTLKNNPITNSIPVLMLTANDMVKSVDQAKESGSDGYLVKPLRVDRLREKLSPFIKLTGT